MFVAGMSKSFLWFKRLTTCLVRITARRKIVLIINSKNKFVKLIDPLPKKDKIIALVVDSCPVESSIDNLESIKLIVLVPNTTLKVQPID